MKRIILLTLFISFHFATLSQSNAEIAREKCNKAIEMMDNGQIEESVKILEECIKLDPGNQTYPYEIGYAYYISKDYKKTIKQLTPLSKLKEPRDHTFQLLGNSYDLLGKPRKAIETYEDGLKALPRSGRLHLELGGMYEVAGDYDKAINYFEKGIEAEPAYPSTYYRLTKLFLNSDQEVWGMIYGELFMNLERNTKRTAEISKLLYDTYKKAITFTSDTSFSVSFSKFNILDLSQKQMTLPFGMGIYEPTLIMAMVTEKTIDLASLNRIRTNFITSYYDNKRNEKFPNVLFDYQNKVLAENHIEAYNYWILMKGDELAFTSWQLANGDKWKAFVEWFNPNHIDVTEENKFIRTQYQ
jgi:tetratricopeptide (TPR) repeat protein